MSASKKKNLCSLSHKFMGIHLLLFTCSFSLAFLFCMYSFMCGWQYIFISNTIKLYCVRVKAYTIPTNTCPNTVTFSFACITYRYTLFPNVALYTLFFVCSSASAGLPYKTELLESKFFRYKISIYPST